MHPGALCARIAVLLPLVTVIRFLKKSFATETWCLSRLGVLIVVTELVAVVNVGSGSTSWLV